MRKLIPNRLTKLMLQVKEKPDSMEGRSIMENSSEPTERTKVAPELWNNKVSLSLGNKAKLGHEIQKYLRLFFSESAWS